MTGSVENPTGYSVVREQKAVIAEGHIDFGRWNVDEWHELLV
jgi:hypothetical protein